MVVKGPVVDEASPTILDKTNSMTCLYFFKNNFSSLKSPEEEKVHNGVFADMYLENHLIYQDILKSSCLEWHVVNRLKLPKIVCKHFVRKQNHTGNSFEKVIF